MSTQAAHILLVEDEPAHAELVLAAFEDGALAAEVTTASNVSEARTCLASSAFDLVITDWHLPDGDAYELLSERAPEGDVPFVVMTSHGDERLAVGVMKAGALDYVVKSSETLLEMPHVAERALREARHIRELRETKAELHRTAANLDSIVRSVPDIIYRLDQAGRITFVSQAVQRYGYQPEELVGRHLLELVHPADRARARYRIAERRTGERAACLVEFRLLTSDAEHRVFEVHGQDALPVLQVRSEGLYATEHPCTASFLGTQGIARDITDRKASEAQMRQLVAAIEGSTDGLLLLDREDRIVYANRACESITGMPIGELLGQPRQCAMHALQDAADPLTGVQPDAAPAALPDEPWTWRGRLSWASGRSAIVEASGGPIQGDAETATGQVIRLTDITTRAELETKLQQAARLEALATLAGGIAHDFNNILAAIMGYVELAMTTVDSTNTAHDDLEQVLLASHRAGDLAQQILAFARQSDSVRTPLNLGTLAKEAVKLLRATLPPWVQVTHRIAPRLPAVEADPTQMHQVVMNLCTNAAHAIGESTGELSLSLHCRELDAEAAVREGLPPAPGEFLCLTVSDTGGGIAPDVLPRIFDPFFTTKPVGRGTGLGLAMVHGIITAHGGAIRVESTLGKGSSFIVLLPVCATDEGATATDEEPAAAAGRVMVVDDEASLATMMRRMLSAYGYEVLVAQDPADAIARLEADANAVDAVVTDNLMPTMKGTALLERLRAIRPDLPAVIATGHASDEVLEAARQNPHTVTLEKPVRMRALAEALRRCMES